MNDLPPAAARTSERHPSGLAAAHLATPTPECDALPVEVVTVGSQEGPALDAFGDASPSESKDHFGGGSDGSVEMQAGGIGTEEKHVLGCADGGGARSRAGGGAAYDRDRDRSPERCVPEPTPDNAATAQGWDGFSHVSGGDHGPPPPASSPTSDGSPAQYTSTATAPQVATAAPSRISSQNAPRNKGARNNIWITSPLEAQPPLASSLLPLPMMSSGDSHDTTVAATPTTVASHGPSSDGHAYLATSANGVDSETSTNTTGRTANHGSFSTETRPPSPNSSEAAPREPEDPRERSMSSSAGFARGTGLDATGRQFATTTSGLSSTDGVYEGGGVGRVSGGISRADGVGVGDCVDDSFSTSFSGGAGGEEESPAQVVQVRRRPVNRPGVSSSSASNSFTLTGTTNYKGATPPPFTLENKMSSMVSDSRDAPGGEGGAWGWADGRNQAPSAALRRMESSGSACRAARRKGVRTPSRKSKRQESQVDSTRSSTAREKNTRGNSREHRSSFHRNEEIRRYYRHESSRQDSHHHAPSRQSSTMSGRREREAGDDRSIAAPTPRGYYGVTPSTAGAAGYFGHFGVTPSTAGAGGGGGCGGYADSDSGRAADGFFALDSGSRRGKPTGTAGESPREGAVERAEAGLGRMTAHAPATAMPERKRAVDPSHSHLPTPALIQTNAAAATDSSQYAPTAMPRRQHRQRRETRERSANPNAREERSKTESWSSNQTSGARETKESRSSKNARGVRRTGSRSSSTKRSGSCGRPNRASSTATTGGSGNTVVTADTRGSSSAARGTAGGSSARGTGSVHSSASSRKRRKGARDRRAKRAREKASAENGIVMASAVERGKKEERAREWEADVAWRSALPARMERLAEAATVENVDDAPTELRKAWRWDEFPEVAKMLNDVADAMAARGFHEQAADLFERAIEIYLCYTGPKGYGGRAEALNDLGYVLWDACADAIFTDIADDLAFKLMEDAERVFRRALAECRDRPGRDHPYAAVCFTNVADCASTRRGHEEAKALLQSALRVREKSLGPNHLDTADTLLKLGSLHREQGSVQAAEVLYSRALSIYKECLGPNHDDVGSALNLLAVVVGEQGRYLEAENLHRSALAQRRNAGASGPEDLAPMCYNLALVVGTNARKGPASRRAAGELESEQLLHEALVIYEKGFGPDHPEVADCMDKLAAAVAMNGNLSKAEVLHKQALDVMERTFGESDPQVAEVLFNLSAVVGAQNGRLEETELLLHRCLEAQRTLRGPDHPEVLLVLDRLAEVIRARDAPEACRDSNGAEPAMAVTRDGAAHELSTGGSLTASRRNGGPLSWWREDSLTSRGSSWFESGPSARGSRSRSSLNTPASLAGDAVPDASASDDGDVESDDPAPRKEKGINTTKGLARESGNRRRGAGGSGSIRKRPKSRDRTAGATTRGFGRTGSALSRGSSRGTSGLKIKAFLDSRSGSGRHRRAVRRSTGVRSTSDCGSSHSSSYSSSSFSSLASTGTSTTDPGSKGKSPVKSPADSARTVDNNTIGIKMIDLNSNSKNDSNESSRTLVDGAQAPINLTISSTVPSTRGVVPTPTPSPQEVTRRTHLTIVSSNTMALPRRETQEDVGGGQDSMGSISTAAESSGTRVESGGGVGVEAGSQHRVMLAHGDRRRRATSSSTILSSEKHTKKKSGDKSGTPRNYSPFEDSGSSDLSGSSYFGSDSGRSGSRSDDYSESDMSDMTSSYSGGESGSSYDSSFSEGYGSFSDSVSNATSGTVTDHGSRGERSFNDSGGSILSTSATSGLTSGGDTKSSNVNYWSDGVFESSGASTPGGPQQRSAAHCRRFPEDSPGDNPVTLNSMVHAGANSAHRQGLADDPKDRAHSLRMIRKSARSRSRSSSRSRDGSRGRRSVCDKKRAGEDGQAAAFDSASNPAIEGGGLAGTTGSGRFAGKKIEAKGLRRRARAIRGALLRRGATEKNRGTTAGEPIGAAAVGGGGGGGVGKGAVAGVGDAEDARGSAGRKQHLQLRLHSDHLTQLAASGATSFRDGWVGQPQDASALEQKAAKIAAARRSAAAAAPGRAGLAPGLTPWDSSRHAGEKLTSSSSFSGDDDDDSEPESTAQRLDGNSNGGLFFTPIIPLRPEAPGGWVADQSGARTAADAHQRGGRESEGSAFPGTPSFGVVNGRGPGGNGMWDRFVGPNRSAAGGGRSANLAGSARPMGQESNRNPTGSIVATGAAGAGQGLNQAVRSHGSDECLPASLAALGGRENTRRQSERGTRVVPRLPTPTMPVWKGIAARAAGGGGAKSGSKKPGEQQPSWLNCVVFSPPSG